MYIRKQPSGNTSDTAEQRQRGRGEYEISGAFEPPPPAAPILPRQLFDLPLYIRFGGYGYKPTGCVLRGVHGKKRLQLIDHDHSYIHAARQVQAALLLPEPRRDEHGLIGGQPTILLKRYIVRRMNFAAVATAADRVNVQLGLLDLYNGSQEDAIDFAQRMAEVEHVHHHADQFPGAIRSLLNEHRQLLEAPAPLPARAEDIVSELMLQAQDIAPDYNIDYVLGTDVMAPLNEIVDLPPVPQPLSIESIPQEDIEIRLREASKWRRFAAARGPESAAFRREVRQAYNSTCVVCGIHLPRSDWCRVPGVDAAHILPWRTHEMEFVCNGLCLCKMHHWAFDQLLIAVTFQNGEYRVEVTQRATRALGLAALAQLQAVAGPIPDARLPQELQHRPRQQFLTTLYELLDI